MSFTNHVQPVSSHETSRTPDHPVQFIGSSDLFKKHFSRLYGFLLAAIGLASTLHHAFIYDPKHPVNFYEIFYIVIYAFAASVLICLLVWLHRMKKLTLEKTGNSNLVGYDGEGFNLYLKGGVILFSVISVIYNLIRIVSATLSGFDHCGGVAYLFFCLSQAAFVSLLALFLILHDRVVIREPTFLIRLFFIHILVCCICTWFHAGIGEIRERIANEDATKNNSTGARDHRCPYIFGYNPEASSFFLPFVCEISVLSTAMIHEIYDRMENIEQFKPNGEVLILVSSRLSHFLQYRRAFVAGIIFFCLSFLYSIVVVLLKGTRNIDYTIFYMFTVQGITTGILGITIASITYYKMLHLHVHNKEGNGVDRHILWISNFGALFNAFCNVYILLITLWMDELAPRLKMVVCLELIHFIVSIIDMSLQIMVVLSSLHRVIWDADNDVKTWSRLIIFLLFIDLSLWASNVIQSGNFDITAKMLPKNPFKGSQFLSITHLALPFAFLFRFHITACLSMTLSRSPLNRRSSVHSSTNHSSSNVLSSVFPASRGWTGAMNGHSPPASSVKHSGSELNESDTMSLMISAFNLK